MKSGLIGSLIVLMVLLSGCTVQPTQPTGTNPEIVTIDMYLQVQSSWVNDSCDENNINIKVGTIDFQYGVTFCSVFVNNKEYNSLTNPVRTDYEYTIRNNRAIDDNTDETVFDATQSYEIEICCQSDTLNLSSNKLFKAERTCQTVTLGKSC